MWIVLIIIVGLGLSGLIYLAILDANYHVRRKLECDVPVEELFNAILDLKHWPDWNPWLLHEPDTSIEIGENYQQQGGYYSWDGKVVGAGRLSHAAIEPNRRIQQQIEFFRPFKSVNEVNWYFEKRDGRSLIEWEMLGRMPFLFRFMAKTTEAMIARDYDLGLALLLGHLRPHAPHPRLAFRGRESLDDFHYWAIPFVGRLRELQSSRKSSLASLEKAADGKAGLGLTLYRKIDEQQASFDAEFAIPVAGKLPDSSYPTRTFSGGAYFQVELFGDLNFLPLAWYAAFAHCRMHKIKLDKARPFLEIYHRVSTDDSNQTRTILYLPLKS